MTGQPYGTEHPCQGSVTPRDLAKTLRGDYSDLLLQSVYLLFESNEGSGDELDYGQTPTFARYEEARNRFMRWKNDTAEGKTIVVLEEEMRDRYIREAVEKEQD